MFKVLGLKVSFYYSCSMIYLNPTLIIKAPVCDDFCLRSWTLQGHGVVGFVIYGFGAMRI